MLWKNLKIAAIWCRQHWRWLVLSIAFLAVYYIGRKDLKSLKIQAELARKQYLREKEAIEKAHEYEIKKRDEAEKRYSDAVNKIEERYEKNKWNLTHAKKEEIKKMIRKAKQDPDEVDRILEEQLGIKKQ
jgi:Icc-related predicted phosphoesterase